MVASAAGIWVATFLLTAFNVVNDRSSLRELAILAQVGIVIGVSYPVVGALAVRQDQRNLFGWIAWVAGVVTIANNLIGALGVALETRFPRMSDVLLVLSEVTWFVGAIVVLTAGPLLFPSGARPRGAGRIALIAASAGIALVQIPLIVFAVAKRAEFSTTGELPSLTPGVAVTVGIGTVACVSSALTSVFLLVRRMRGSQGGEREQLKWYVTGVACAGVVVLAQLFGIVPEPASQVVWTATAILPLCLAVAVVRHRLFDLDFLISRTLLWTSLTAFVVLLYVLIVGVVGERILSMSGTFPAVVAASVVAIGIQPFRDAAQGVINRRVFGDRDDPYAALTRLGQRLESAPEPAGLPQVIVDAVAQSLRSPYVAITFDDDSTAPVAESSRLSDDHQFVRLPLMFQSESIGQLIVAERGPKEAFAESDLRLLRHLAAQSGAAAHAARATIDLRQSRERIVSAREEERRRIRNDLHDGLGPVLSGMKLRAETARNLAPGDPELRRLLDDMVARTESAVRDVRSMVYSLRPPALDDLGLVGALRELTLQLGIAANLDVDPALPPLPAAVEVAVYRIVQEAIVNVTRHSSATSCSISIAFASTALAVVVSDNGRGIAPSMKPGIGMKSMRARSEELGGRLRIVSEAGRGTNVHATLPLVLVPADQSPDHVEEPA